MEAFEKNKGQEKGKVVMLENTNQSFKRRLYYMYGVVDILSVWLNQYIYIYRVDVLSAWLNQYVSIYTLYIYNGFVCMQS